MKFAVTRFDPSLHSSFVFAEIRRAARKFPYALPGVDERVMENVLLGTVRRAIVSNPRAALIAHDEASPETYYGFVISPGPQRVTFAYTKYALRRMGVCSSLLQALGIDPSQPLPVQIWSPAASRIAAKGYRIFPEVIEPTNERANEPRQEPTD